jgi:hypothetical protein
MELLKATSARLAAAKSMSFTAVVNYEFPSKLGPPIAYTIRYDVSAQRPDKLRIVSPGDGPASEFYYDGKAMMAYAPAEDLVAVADAPPTIDATLKKAYDSAAIYFPFTDMIVADPYAALTDGAKLAFYIGPSGVVGGVGQRRRVPADLDRRRRQAAAPDSRGVPRRSAAAAPRDGAVELEARRGDGGGNLCVAEGAGGEAHRLQEPRSDRAGGGQAAGEIETGQGGGTSAGQGAMIGVMPWIESSRSPLR